MFILTSYLIHTTTCPVKFNEQRIFLTNFRVSISLDVNQDGVLNNVIVTPGTPTPEELQAQEQIITMSAPGMTPPPMKSFKPMVNNATAAAGQYISGPVSSSTTPAVCIRNACKSYVPGKPILDKLDMTVPRGTM